MDTAIETVQLTKYYGQTRGIEGVNLEVQTGEIFGFIGPNGAGKTTTIRTLMDIIFPTKGSARIFGLDCHTHSKKIKQNIGYLPSDDHFYSNMNGRRLLSYAARIRGLDRNRTEDRIQTLASQLDLDLDSPIKTLSRGNRRKVSIINTVLSEPSLLILDEPTSGLDPLIQKRFFDLIASERDRGATVFFSSHVLSDVQKVCNRVAIIRDGQIVRTDSIDSLAKEHRIRVVLEVEEGQTVGDILIEGAEEIERVAKSIRFFYRGDVGNLLEQLADPGLRKKLVDVSIKRSSLEEIFMDYYRSEEAEV